MHSKEAEGVGGVFVVKTVAIGIQNFRGFIGRMLIGTGAVEVLIC